MTSWLFVSDMEGWQTNVAGPMVWEGTEGSPAPGCLKRVNLTGPAGYSASAFLTNQSIAVQAGDIISLRHRRVWTAENDTVPFDVSCEVTIGSLYQVIFESYVITVGAGDSGWQIENGVIPVDGILTEIFISQTASFLISLGITVYLDSVILSETVLPAATLNYGVGNIDSSVSIQVA